MAREAEFGYVVETRAGFIASISDMGEVRVSLSMQEAMRVTFDFAHDPLLQRVAPMACWLVPYQWDGKS